MNATEVDKLKLTMKDLTQAETRNDAEHRTNFRKMQTHMTDAGNQLGLTFETSANITRLTRQITDTADSRKNQVEATVSAKTVLITKKIEQIQEAARTRME